MSFFLFPESEPFVTFLNRATTFEDAMKELTKASEARPLAEIITQYGELFPGVVNLPLPENVDQEVDGLKEFCTVSEQKMNVLAGAAESLCKSVIQCCTDVGKVNGALAQNYDVERGFNKLPQPPRVDIMEPFLAWHLSLKWSSHAYDDLLLSPIRHEQQDLTAMLDCIKTRSDLAAAYKKSLAKVTKWNEPKNAPKNEKQEAQKAADEKACKEEKELLDIIDRIILHSQFDQVWKFRVQQFRRRINAFAKAQVNLQAQLADTWNTVADGTSCDD